MADRPPDSTITTASSNPSSDAKAEAAGSLIDKTQDTEASEESTAASAATAASVASSPDATAAADEPFVGVQATTKVSESLGWKVYHDAPKPWSKEEKDKYFADMETHPLFMDEDDVETAEKEVCL